MFVVLTDDYNLYSVDLMTMKLFQADRSLDYRGWLCTVDRHVLSINYKANGTKLSPGICMAKPKKYTTPDEFELLPDEHGLICPKKECFCGPDVSAPKAKDRDSLNALIDKVNQYQPSDMINLPVYDGGTAIAVCNPAYIWENRFHVDWYIGKRCNFDCSYCLPAIHDTKSPHRTFDELKDIYDRVRDIYHIKSRKSLMVQFSGGEPTVIPAFLDLVKYIYDDTKDMGDAVNLRTLTNMSRKPEYYAELNQYSRLVCAVHPEFATPEREDNIVKFLGLRDETSKDIDVHALFLPKYKDQIIKYYHRLEGLDDVESFHYRAKPLRDKVHGSHIVYTDEELEMIPSMTFDHIKE